ncbi:MAG: hypothetical protein HEEMFOPI_01658 [Holosporales bacterium]
MKISSEYIISEAKIEDAEEIVFFLNNVGGETDFLTFGKNDFPYSGEDERKIIENCLILKQDLMLVCTFKSEIIGHLFLSRSKQTRLAHIANIGVSVYKQYWGEKIASMMLLKSIEFAKKNGINRLEVYVRKDNLMAINLYLKLNFEIESIIKKNIKINNDYYDNYLMVLFLPC